MSSRFQTIPYMYWAKQHMPEPANGELNLAESGMPPPAGFLKELGIDLNEIPLVGDNCYGYQPLRDSIANRYSVSPSQVMNTNGSSMANFLLFAVLTDPGDTLVIETPTYQCLPAVAENLGLHVKPVQRRAENKWQIDIGEVIELVRSTHAKGIVLTNPHNPSGVIIPEVDLIQLASGVGEEVFVLVDEVYIEWLKGFSRKTSGLAMPNIYATSSLTKVWGFGQLRAGWAIAPEKVVDMCYRAYDHIGVINPIITDAIATEIYRHPTLLDDIRRKNKQILTDGRKVVDTFLAGEPGQYIHASMPDGGGFAFWAIDGIASESDVKKFRDDTGIAVVPGVFFGDENYVRISWTQGEDVVSETLDRLRNWLKKQ